MWRSSMMTATAAAVTALALVGSTAPPTAPVSNLEAHVQSSPVLFRVGAAVQSIDPTAPVYMGGYGGGPAGGTLARHVNLLTCPPGAAVDGPTNCHLENFTTRAIAIVRGTHVIEMARVDTQGWFAGVQQGPYGITDVRDKVASWLQRHGEPGASPGDLIVSSDHEHAAPTLMGIWGPPDAPVEVAYLRQVATATVQALEQAYLRARPATLWWGSVQANYIPTESIANANADEGWPDDGSLLALRAVNVRTGRTIATYVDQPGYPNIVYGPADLLCPAGVSAAVLSPDFPFYTQRFVEKDLGGIAVVADGTLGDQPGPMQGDTAPSSDLPPEQVTTPKGRTVTCRQTAAFDDIVHMGELEANLVATALGGARQITGSALAGAQQYLSAPIDNPALLALSDVAPFDDGTPWTEAGGDAVAYPIDHADQPPYQVGGLLGTWVTALRIGDLLLVSEPGEFFPSIHEAWDQAIPGAHVFVVGMGQDDLGYYGPVGAYPFSFFSADQSIFNASIPLGDEVVTAGEQDARRLGFAANLTTTAEMSDLNEGYLKAFQPGVQIIPFPESGDLSPTTGTWAPVLQGFSSPPQFGVDSACYPPGDLGSNVTPPTVPGCPLGRPPTMGPYHWSFGDGTTAVTPAGRDYYFSHTYHDPGIYLVRATAVDSAGKRATFAVPVVVFPALHVSVRHTRGQSVVVVRGGSGHVLLVRWHLAGGQTSYGSSVPTSSHPVSVYVTDSTGTTVTVAVR